MPMLSKKYYVYYHKNSNSGEIFYVGKGKGSRCRNTKYRNHKWKSYVDDNLNYDIVIYKENLSELDAFGIEEKLSNKYKPCCNIIVGKSDHGKITSKTLREFYKSPKGVQKREETRNRMKLNNPMKSDRLRNWQRNRNMGDNNFFHKLSDESKIKHRNNVSKSKLGRKNPRSKLTLYIPTKIIYGSRNEMLRSLNKKLSEIGGKWKYIDTKY